MFSSNDYLLSKLAKHHEAQLIERRRVDSLLRDSRARAGLGRRLLAKSRHWLILLGLRLKASLELKARAVHAQRRPRLEGMPCD